jgi:hypothetical protein
MQEEPREKLPYEKPELGVIELVAEEVLTTGCKMTQTGPGSVGVCVSGGTACFNDVGTS